MSANQPSAYGRDIACRFDADKLLTSVVGLEVVVQTALHRITTDDIPGDDGTGSLIITGWGFDLRRLVGSDPTTVASHGPVVAEVLTRDERIETVDVTLTATTTNGLADILFEANGTTAAGPFSLVRLVSQLTAADLVVGQ